MGWGWERGVGLGKRGRPGARGWKVTVTSVLSPSSPSPPPSQSTLIQQGSTTSIRTKYLWYNLQVLCSLVLELQEKNQDNCLSLLNHGYCIVGYLTLAKICLSISFYLPENSGFPNTCLTTGSESVSSAAQPKSIILTFGNGPASKRRF